MNFSRFESPVFGQKAQELYMTIYGDMGAQYVELLHSSPYEVAVISRIIAYLASKMGGK